MLTSFIAATRVAVAVTALTLVGTSCRPNEVAHVTPTPSPATRWTDTRGFANGRIRVGDAAIHYVDYGGSGPPLVLLAGLGNSAHVFDDFAPRLTDAYHVVALTRRGFGESSRPDGGYDTATLASDVVAVMDSLSLERVALVGHSVAGDELSEIAVRAPSRVNALVYLDAAYDRSGMRRRLLTLAMTKGLPPSPPKANRRDKESAEAYRRYLAKSYGVSWPLTEVLATREFDGDGRYVRDRLAARTSLAILSGERVPEYARIQAPVLAIYATDRGIDQDASWIPKLTIGRAKTEQQARRAISAQREWESGNRRQLRLALPRARIVELPQASHYVFISDADHVEREIRTFLGGGQW